ncbi:sigma-70 family RNA polymerase sigma factor [Myxococcus sp. CA051A]|uniref:Sigma-70 family RNA polymerase sigma factor n=1 Tax=Myxococcus llanfairpwllgwyngyllgogerychwyrndrobwllllantysiliogogogochensis TaxID=2590453 RepID=A0A540WVM8_9BACT|nr:sigma-70 family RNA polymerase sigma factor [Myxococcus llanfairpwllgwyngyllgogerychwyrndrobwllllantysiliogogogochensis]NTX14802.1 sigma-70 family RNA polymerase sigma factor [Myxococcus sp. CA056]NTX40615.1 sigma-70 family RNA polymerase sigma factor [Myxococcus sp. CA033]NTX55089.1 sigma-70 family RNA polymerase sigma factor [Myxococcus sp. CA039A]NTX66636.1 sigma-70 family RNA polymerase sigma factor [Myxococcus sp. CA051A]TQF12980.1 sigma-70 family RNA polymerase sigma factor [Myxococcu
MKGTAILEEPGSPARAVAALDFDALLEAEQGVLLRLARRLVWDGEEARDLVQAALADAYEKRHLLRDAKAGPAWLRRILVSRAMGHLRRRRVWNVLREALDWGTPLDLSPEERFVGAERWRALGRAVRALPAQQSTAFTLRYLEGLELDAVAEAMGIGRGTVRIHLYRALKKLKAEQALEGDTP